jgi:hypothetical protein
VGREGQIRIPDEALEEYHLISGEVFVLPGSKTSGGFALSSLELLKKSPLSIILDSHVELADYSSQEGKPVYDKGKPYCWVMLRDREIKVPLQTLREYGIGAGDRLLVVRGSGLALGFVVKGPIVEEAHTHPEIITVTWNEKH